MLYSHTKKTYFPGLNGVRFLAAAAVWLFHVSDLLHYADLPYFEMPLSVGLGQKGVTAFFVLSGFLITYLLLEESNNTGTIHIGKFYLRRMLRTWPLYYLVIFIGYFVFPYFIAGQTPYTPAIDADFLLFVLLLPNFAGDGTKFVKHTWSVGVEEQFYLLWPWLVKNAQRVLPRLFAAVIIGKLAISAGITLVIHSPWVTFERSISLLHLQKLFDQLQFESMAVGGTFAYLLFADWDRFSKLLQHPVTKAVTVVSITILLITKPGITAISTILASVPLAFLITTVACSREGYGFLKTPVLDYLGRISYGFYMFHQMVIYACILTLSELSLHTESLSAFIVLLYCMSFIAATALASVSYHYIELPFIRLKTRFNPM